MDLTSMATQIVFTDPDSTCTAEHKTFSVKMCFRLRYVYMGDHGVFYLPHWCILEWMLCIVTIPKCEVVEGYPHLFRSGSGDPGVENSFVVHRLMCFNLRILNEIINE